MPVLDGLHASSPGARNIGCACMIHEIFAGQLQSEVRCGSCGNASTAVDAMVDLSLDIGGSTSLFDCLDRYTAPERLAPKQYTCDRCGDATEPASKQLSIRSLPPVLCIQLKVRRRSAARLIVSASSTVAPRARSTLASASRRGSTCRRTTRRPASSSTTRQRRSTICSPSSCTRARSIRATTPTSRVTTIRSVVDAREKLTRSVGALQRRDRHAHEPRRRAPSAGLHPALRPIRGMTKSSYIVSAHAHIHVHVPSRHSAPFHAHTSPVAHRRPIGPSVHLSLVLVRSCPVHNLAS